MKPENPHLADIYLGKWLRIQVDRPLGSRHPDWGFIYPLNYGYVPGTRAPDGEEIDAYILGVFEPLQAFRGRCIAILHRRDDRDPKLILAPEGISYSDEQVLALVAFQERHFDTVVESWEMA